ncbi:MAG: carbohydrate porin [Vampirovibrionales bacterium]
MTTRRLTSVLLAGSIALAGVVVTTDAEARLEALSTTRVEDTRLTSMDQMIDVPTSSWAYDAVKELVEKYDVIEGYKKGDNFVYKGNNFVTRYELAAALRDTLRGMDAKKVYISNGDAATIANLKKELAPELAALESRLDALETKVANVGLGSVKLSGDAVAGFNHFMETGDNAVDDGTSGIGRIRLNVEATALEDKGERLGEGRLKARLVAAAGNNVGGINGNSRIAADASSNNEGPGGTTPMSTNRSNAYFDRIAYEQDFRLFNNVHTVYAGLVPWRDYFDKSAYRGDENAQFQNVGLVNIAGLATNINAFMLGDNINFKLNDDASAHLNVAYGSANGANVQNLNFATTEARLNYNWANLDNRKTSAYVGGIFTFNNSDNLQPTRTAYTNALGNLSRNPGKTVYAGLDQEIYKGIGVNLGYMYNAGRANDAALVTLNPTTGSAAGSRLNRNQYNVRQAASVALHIPTKTLGFRDGDSIGVGYVATSLVSSGSLEQIMETYYNYKLNDRVSVIPSFQLGNQFNGARNSDTSFTAGLRTAIKF